MGLWRRFRRLPRWLQVPIGAAVGFFALAVVTAPFAPKEDQDVAASVATATTVSTTVPAPTSTSTTLPPLPAGDDASVTSVTDGDSLVVTDGTRIRLIGIDAPDVETDDCYSAEATAHLRQLLPEGSQVRIVYDVGRLDVFGRTLAFVYRLPDGLFVNLTLARDGFVQLLTVPPNVAHAEELRDAVAEARDATRGLWSSCQTSTSMTTTTAPSVQSALPAVSDPAPTTTAGPRADDDAVRVCHPSYTGACVPVADDVDCGGGGGDGPAYVFERDFDIVGPDVFGLDGNPRNGIGCDS
jgi:micrococcal nuclease